jgi:DNA-binding FadR family transcriptional regulator
LGTVAKPAPPNFLKGRLMKITDDSSGRRGGPTTRNLTYTLLDQVGRAIVAGEYETMSVPTEAEIAKEHGVSRSVTREALKMLTAKGLLTAAPRRGTTVMPPTAWNLFDGEVLRWILERRFSIDMLRQFSQLRAAVEPAAAALAAEEADEVAIARIASAYDWMDRTTRAGEDALDADIAFHVAILRASGNPFFFQFRGVVETALRYSLGFSTQGHEPTLDTHRAVLEAIRQHDAIRARTTMEAVVFELLDAIAMGETPTPIRTLAE